MKIEVAKSDLDNAIQIVSIGTSGSGSDLTTHYVFRHKDDQTKIMAYNGRLGTSSPLVCSCSPDDGEDAANAFTIESWRLNQWLKAASDAALTLESKDAIVTATAPSGSVRFRSLDPSGFPFWDKTLAKAKAVTHIEASRLHAALAHAKSFISTADTTRPDMAVTEIRGGALWATDQAALTIVTLEEFAEFKDAKTTLRMHGKDIPSVLAFLALSADDKVQLKAHARSLFVVRDDGSELSVGRPTQPFVELEDIEDEEPTHWWTLGCALIDRIIKQLAASAAKEHHDVQFNFDPDTQKVQAAMTGDSGSTNTLTLECPEFGSRDDASQGLPEEGWVIEYPYLQRLLSTYKGGKTIKFGLNPAGEDGGWTRFSEDRDGDKYLTILVWK